MARPDQRRTYGENRGRTPEVRALLDFLQENKIDLKVAAKKAGIGYHTIKDWRAGRATPKPEFIKYVEQAVGFTRG